MTRSRKPRPRTGFCQATKKVRYPDSLSAKMALSTLRRVSDRERVPSREYSCQHCKGWHLTSQPKKNKVIDARAA